MVRRTRNSEYATAFGKALDAQLAKRQWKQTDLARATHKSPAYINRLMTGAAKASPEWADLVASVMRANPIERQQLHRAAALDAGYKIETDAENP